MHENEGPILSLAEALMSHRFDDLFDDIEASSIPIQFVSIIRVVIGDSHSDILPRKFKKTVRETVLSEIDKSKRIDDIRVMIDIEKLAEFVDSTLDVIFRNANL